MSASGRGYRLHFRLVANGNLYRTKRNRFAFAAFHRWTQSVHLNVHRVFVLLPTSAHFYFTSQVLSRWEVLDKP